jgi:hypothetical protein
MKLTIENKKYETGKASPSILKLCAIAEKKMNISEQSTQEELFNAGDILEDILCRFLISGTNKIPYRNITQDMIDELKPIMEDNYTFIDMMGIFGDIMREISEGKEAGGK